MSEGKLLLERTSFRQKQKAAMIAAMDDGIRPLTHLDAGPASAWLVRSLGGDPDQRYVVTLVPELKRATCDCLHARQAADNVCAHMLAAGLAHVARIRRAAERARRRAELAEAMHRQAERERDGQE